MITIVDYGVGNVQAFLNVYKRLNIPARRASTPTELAESEKVILPGVGAFDNAMQRLDASGLRSTLDTLALETKVPLLGVCVGMQMLGKSSDEGSHAGLGWIDATTKHFSSLHGDAAQPLPHMGWNDVAPRGASPLFNGLENEARFYFLHSYYVDCIAQNVLASTRYGGDFASAVHSGNIFGVQFHPEKSHQFGTRLLKNFADL